MDIQDYTRFVAPIKAQMVNSIWRIVRHQQDTEDVLQDVLVLVMRRIGKVRRHPCPAALILRMCVNGALDHLRKRHGRGKGLESWRRGREAEPTGAAPGDRLSSEEQQAWVLELLRGLPKREAEAIVLVAVEELSYREIGKAMGCRESTVRVLVSKARRRLKAAYGGSSALLNAEVSES